MKPITEELQIKHITCRAEVLGSFGKNFECTKNCGKTFQSLPSLNMHLSQYHDHVRIQKSNKEQQNIEERYHCPIRDCSYYYDRDHDIQAPSKYFQKLGYLKQHYLKMHVEASFACGSCTRRFSTKPFLRHHEKYCKVNLDCSCKQWFSSLPSLQTHLRRTGHRSPVLEEILKQRKAEKLKNKKMQKRPKIIEKSDIGGNDQQGHRCHQGHISEQDRTHHLAALALSELSVPRIHRPNSSEVSVQTDPVIIKKAKKTQKNKRTVEIETQTFLTNSKWKKKRVSKSIPGEFSNELNTKANKANIFNEETLSRGSENFSRRKNMSENLHKRGISKTLEIENRKSEKDSIIVDEETVEVSPGCSFIMGPYVKNVIPGGSTKDIFNSNEFVFDGASLTSNEAYNIIYKSESSDASIIDLKEMSNTRTKRAIEMGKGRESYSFEMGESYPIEMGKGRESYSFEMGESYPIEMGKGRESYSFEMGKGRESYPIEMGKGRESYSIEMGKGRESYPFEMGKGRESYPIEMGESYSIEMGKSRESYSIEICDNDPANLSNDNSNEIPLSMNDNRLYVYEMDDDYHIFNEQSSSQETQTEQDVFLNSTDYDQQSDEITDLISSETQTDWMYRVDSPSLVCSSETQTCEEFSVVEPSLRCTINTQTDAECIELFPELNNFMQDNFTQTPTSLREYSPDLVSSHTQTMSE